MNISSTGPVKCSLCGGEPGTHDTECPRSYDLHPDYEETRKRLDEHLDKLKELRPEAYTTHLPDPRSFWEKLRNKLFPSKFCPLPSAPEEYKGCIFGYAVTKFDFKDRLRVLITGTVVTSWKTVTQNEIGGSVTEATCHVGTSADWK